MSYLARAASMALLNMRHEATSFQACANKLDVFAYSTEALRIIKTSTLAYSEGSALRVTWENAASVVAIKVVQCRRLAACTSHRTYCARCPSALGSRISNRIVGLEYNVANDVPQDRARSQRASG